MGFGGGCGQKKHQKTPKLPKKKHPKNTLKKATLVENRPGGQRNMAKSAIRLPPKAGGWVRAAQKYQKLKKYYKIMHLGKI